MTLLTRSLGANGSSLLASMTQRGKRVFTLQEAIDASSWQGNRLRQLLAKLVKRGWLQRIERGKYLILPLEAGREGEWTEHEFIVASCLVEPYYIGFRSALNFYGYSDQVSRTVYIVSTRRKMNPRLEISGVNYHVVHTVQKKFFGIDQVRLNDTSVNISDREKTVVDCLDRQEYSGGVSEVVKAITGGRSELDFPRMARHAVALGNRAVCSRLGFILEQLGIHSPPALKTLREALGNSYAPLDTLSNSRGGYLQRWKLAVNVTDDEIRRWKEIR